MVSAELLKRSMIIMNEMGSLPSTFAVIASQSFDDLLRVTEQFKGRNWRRLKRELRKSSERNRRRLRLERMC